MTKLDLFIIIVCVVGAIVSGIGYWYTNNHVRIKGKYQRGRYITYKKGAKK